MKNMEFKIGNVKVVIVQTKLPDGNYDVTINATGDKAEIDAVMRSIVTGTMDLNLFPKLAMGKVDGPMEPLTVSELMGGMTSTADKTRYLRCMVHVATLPPKQIEEVQTLLVLPSAKYEGSYKFVYDYPLDNPAEIEHPFTDKTTVIDLMKFGQADYVKIYAEEDATAPVPAQDSQKLANGLTLMNRTRTTGKHGIWGHVLNDLWFEGIHINLDTKTVTFDIGS